MISVSVSWLQLDTAPPDTAPQVALGGGIFTDPARTTLLDGTPSVDDLHQQQIQHEDEALMVVIAQFLVNGVFS